MRMAAGLVQPAGHSVWCLVWTVIVMEVVAARGRMFCVGVSDVEPWGRLTSRCERDSSQDKVGRGPQCLGVRVAVSPCADHFSAGITAPWRPRGRRDVFVVC